MYMSGCKAIKGAVTAKGALWWVQEEGKGLMNLSPLQGSVISSFNY